MNWPEDFLNKLICGDCLEVMKGMPDNSIDTIITDPPYGLEFMGKEWDKFKDTESWGTKELKEQNGIWGGNKEYNPISLLNFKPRMIKTKKELSVYQMWCQNWAAEALRIAKPGATLLCFGGTRTYHRLACAIEDAGWILKDCIMWLYGSGFPKATDISKQIDKIEGKINIIGEQKASLGILDHGREPKYKRENIKKRPITAPATPEATLWNGWKSHGLKPAYEPILVAMKSNEDSYASNALKWGVAGLNIDGGRIRFKGQGDIDRARGRKGKYEKMGMKSNLECHVKITEPLYKSEVHNQGRFPANVILDEESAGMLDEQSGMTSVTGKRKNPLKSYHQPNGGEWFGRNNHNGAEYQDKGCASRFFYCAKASKKERNRGCEGLEEKPAHDYGSIKKSKGRHGKNMPNANHHPTVKPLALMKYLCILTKTPTGGIVLDPFCGSGTTLMACKGLKRDYIGIDNNPEYCEIARKRVNATPESLF